MKPDRNRAAAPGLGFSIIAVAVALTGCSKANSDADHSNADRPETQNGANVERARTESKVLGKEYDRVHPSDEYAAHPRDPDRMAPGVEMDKIVPRLALKHCEQAVKEHPGTARFHYQLGRAYTASGRHEDAFRCYLKADAMGYRMAAFNLGNAYAEGQGVAMDEGKAAQYFARAEQLGVDAKEMLARFVFTAEGYSNPEFFKAAYEGKLKDANPGRLAAYLTEFLSLFRNTDDCRSVVSAYAYSKIAEHGQMDVLGQMLGGMANSRNRHTPGDFAGAAKAGYETGREFRLNLAMQVDKARTDAQLFYDRHGCDSPVARRFFKNIETYAAALGSASFKNAVERNYRR